MLSACPAPDLPGAEQAVRARLRLGRGVTMQAYVMVFFREFLRRFCRGQDFSGYADDDFGSLASRFEPAREHPEITLARYLCHLHNEIYRRGQAGIPMRWKKRMGYAAQKTALLQRSFMWLMHFARMRVRGALYSVMAFLVHAYRSYIAALCGLSPIKNSPCADLKPP